MSLDELRERTFYEFFAGGGLARLGLGPTWRCLFANEWSEKKARSYRTNFRGAEELIVQDVRLLSSSDLPSAPTLAWASFPCQDLSLAGSGGGLAGERSGTFWGFWGLMQKLQEESRAPSLIVIENVVGTLTSNKGRDFQAILAEFEAAGYAYAPLIMDAIHFVPQSRPRLFVVAVSGEVAIPPRLAGQGPILPWHPAGLKSAFSRLPQKLRDNWIWASIPVPQSKPASLERIIEESPSGVEWHSTKETQRLLSLMSPQNLDKVRASKKTKKRVVGALYKRTRPGANGERSQRAEVRFDGVSGCLRTPGGGSSRQTILVVEGGSIKSRLLSPREAARLMGASDDYQLPSSYNEAYHLMGDAVVVPVVGWLEQHLLRPLAQLVVPENVG